MPGWALAQQDREQQHGGHRGSGSSSSSSGPLPQPEKPCLHQLAWLRHGNTARHRVTCCGTAGSTWHTLVSMCAAAAGATRVSLRGAICPPHTSAGAWHPALSAMWCSALRGAWCCGARMAACAGASVPAGCRHPRHAQQLGSPSAGDAMGLTSGQPTLCHGGELAWCPLPARTRSAPRYRLAEPKSTAALSLSSSGKSPPNRGQAVAGTVTCPGTDRAPTGRCSLAPSTGPGSPPLLCHDPDHGMAPRLPQTARWCHLQPKPQCPNTQPGQGDSLCSATHTPLGSFQVCHLFPPLPGATGCLAEEEPQCPCPSTVPLTPGCGQAPVPGFSWPWRSPNGDLWAPGMC